MNKREALKLKKGDKFRRKPSAWHPEGMFPTIFTVERVELTVNYDHSVNEVFIIDSEGKEFLHKDICLP